MPKREAQNNMFTKLGEISEADSKSENSTEQKPISNRKARPQGKRSNPDFSQVGVYLRKDTVMKIRQRLLQESDRDLSDLIEELLVDFLNND